MNCIELTSLTLAALQARTESIFAGEPSNSLPERVRILREIAGSEYDRWIRASRAAANSYYPRWSVPPHEALIRFCGALLMYVDCAAEVLVGAPDSLREPRLRSLRAHAEGVDAVYWMTNRVPEAGVDRTSDRLEERIRRLVRERFETNEAQIILKCILSTAPSNLESHEVYLGRAYGFVRSRIASHHQLPEIIATEPIARQLLALERFDIDHVRARLESGPAWTDVEEHALALGIAERDACIARVSDVEGINHLIEARDALVFASTRLEASFGFRSWPGLVLAAVRKYKA